MNTEIADKIKNRKKLRYIIILNSVVALVSVFPLTITTFAYGAGDSTWTIMFLFPALLLSTILMIANIRLGFYIALLAALIYLIVLNDTIGHVLVFERHNNSALSTILLPFFAFITLIPLITACLAQKLRQKNLILAGTVATVFGLLVFAIADRYNKDYVDYIFIDADIDESGIIRLGCSPNFGDSRTFYMETKSKDLEALIKQYGEYYHGSYFLQHTAITKNFKFAELKSITIRKFGENKLETPLTWNKEELSGDTSFLRP